MLDNNVFIIAEIAQAHDGSLGIAHSYIDALAGTGVDAVKFQLHIAEAESSIYEPFRVKFSFEDATRYDYWKRMEFTQEQWAGLKAHCEDKGMEFMASPFSNAAVDLLEKLGVKKYKIGSGEVSNLLMLEKIAKTGKPVIISSGMSSLNEIDIAVALLKSHSSNFSILQCTAAYPTTPEEWGLNVIQELREKYKVPVGFSDHSGDIYACLAVTALGADILEFHVVFDKDMFGPDAPASLTIDMVKRLVDGIRQIRKSLATPVLKNETAKFTDLKNMFEKSLAVNRGVMPGELITIDMLEAKKPKGYGIPAAIYTEILGKKIKHKLDAWSFLNLDDIL
jgi:N,N'-diacetyllegionaminate synthase